MKNFVLNHTFLLFAIRTRIHTPNAVPRYIRTRHIQHRCDDMVSNVFIIDIIDETTSYTHGLCFSNLSDEK